MGCFNSKISTDQVKDKVVENSQRNVSLRLQAGADGESVKTLTFRHIMKEPLGRAFFTEFLMLEHAEENLMFFEEVERIKDEGESRLKDNAQALVDNFLTPGVETEVNISDHMKRQLTNIATEDVLGRQIEFYKGLERAQNEVMMILAMGPFPRFLKSQHFYNYKVKVRELREKENEEENRPAEKAV